MISSSGVARSQHLVTRVPLPGSVAQNTARNEIAPGLGTRLTESGRLVRDCSPGSSWPFSIGTRLAPTMIKGMPTSAMIPPDTASVAPTVPPMAGPRSLHSASLLLPQFELAFCAMTKPITRNDAPTPVNTIPVTIAPVLFLRVAGADSGVGAVAAVGALLCELCARALVVRANVSNAKLVTSSQQYFIFVFPRAGGNPSGRSWHVFRYCHHSAILRKRLPLNSDGRSLSST